MPRAPLVLFLLLAPLAGALPTPGLHGETFESATGRVFPEALQTNDYVSYDEAVAGLRLLAERHPERVEFRGIGESVGWTPLGGSAAEPKELFAVEVTNEVSAIPFEARLKSVFFLSIHGNEKGGREGGLRAIEDLAAGIGIAEEDPDLVAMLDFQVLVFVFANVDGWTHEELEYRANDACSFSLTCQGAGAGNAGQPGVDAQSFSRHNGHGVDLNRQFPTKGYADTGESYKTLNEPEAQAMARYLKNLTNVAAGADIHGMLNHDHFFQIMLKDGKRSQAELFANERLAELLKERINSNPSYAAWSASPHVPQAWGGEGEFAEWASTIDSIGYTATGTAGAFIVQDIGLDAPGFTIEMAYNHMVADNYYPGAGAFFNDYHVRAVRDTVVTFLRFAAEEIRFSLSANGARVAWLATDFVATNEDDDASQYAGWFTETDADDSWDIAHRTFRASPNDFFDDLVPVARDGASPAVVTEARSADELVGVLDRHTVVVVPGSASEKLLERPDAVGALRSFAERGGRVVLTDSALRLLEPLGLVEPGAVGSVSSYSGYTDLVDRESWVATGVRGDPRQTFDPNPVGFAPDTSPVWYVQEEAWNATGGEALGMADPSSTGAPDAVGNAQGRPAYAPRGVNLGVVPVGKGSVAILGALLPDPTEENLHPYGLDGHSVSAFGNMLFLNLLGFGYVYDTPPVVVEDLGKESSAGTPAAAEPGADRGVPAPAVAAALAAVAAVAFARRRN